MFYQCLLWATQTTDNGYYKKQKLLAEISYADCFLLFPLYVCGMHVCVHTFCCFPYGTGFELRALDLLDKHSTT
jgi:hypothetical protein